MPTQGFPRCSCLPPPHSLMEPLQRGSGLWGLRELQPGSVGGWHSRRVLVSEHVQVAKS